MIILLVNGLSRKKKYPKILNIFIPYYKFTLRKCHSVKLLRVAATLNANVILRKPRENNLCAAEYYQVVPLVVNKPPLSWNPDLPSQAI